MDTPTTPAPDALPVEVVDARAHLVATLPCGGCGAAPGEPCGPGCLSHVEPLDAPTV